MNKTKRDELASNARANYGHSYRIEPTRVHAKPASQKTAQDRLEQAIANVMRCAYRA